ncbi:hypothetical protein V8C86DRAFT_1634794 [Haematococcus lacustris]
MESLQHLSLRQRPLPRGVMAFLVTPWCLHGPQLLQWGRLAASRAPGSMDSVTCQCFWFVAVYSSLGLGSALAASSLLHHKWKLSGEVLLALVPHLLAAACGATQRTVTGVMGVVLVGLYPLLCALTWVVSALRLTH